MKIIYKDSWGNDNPKECIITKETKQYIYFQTPETICPLKYRYSKAKEEVQSAPYFNTIEGLKVEF